MKTIEPARFEEHSDKQTIAEKATTIADDEWIMVGDDNDYFLTCCDCGLSHIVRLRIVDGRIYVQHERDVELTDSMRKQREWPVLSHVSGVNDD